MYVYDFDPGLADGTAPATTLVDELKQHITRHGSSADVAGRIDERRRALRRTLVVIGENHSATNRSADLVRRLLKNDEYRFVASEAFLNAGPLRLEIRQFMQGTRTTLTSINCPYTKVLQDLKRTPRYILFAGTRDSAKRDPRLARHFLEEVVDRKLKPSTPGILVCGINHASRVPHEGQQKTMRRFLEDAGFTVLGLRLATDDFDRANRAINLRTDAVWPVGEIKTESNMIRLLDLVSTTAEYTVLPTRNSPFARVTHDFHGDSSTLSMADRYELVVLAKRLADECRR